MEKIYLKNGNVVNLITFENDTYKYYSCKDFDESVELLMTLTDIGNRCTIRQNGLGWWFVRVLL